MPKKLVPVEATTTAPPRRYAIVGDHSPRCLREKHEDYMHGMETCAVGSSKENHCDCKAHWAEDRSSRLGQ